MMLLCAVADVVTTRTKLMKMMKITEVKEGMITAAAVLTRQNQILAAPGEELDRKLISRMQFYGITEIAIEDDPEAVTAMQEPVATPVPQPVVQPVVQQEPQPAVQPEPEPVNIMQAAHGYSKGAHVRGVPAVHIEFRQGYRGSQRTAGGLCLRQKGF